MPTEPPPSRYRVIERGQRLEVIDTWSGSKPASARVLIGDTIPFAEMDDERAATMPPFDPAPAEVAFNRPASPAPPPVSSPMKRTPEGMATAPPELLRMVATTVCGAARDRDGRPILTTASFYDGKGARDIPLDADGERELGLAVLILLAIAVSTVIFAVMSGWFGIAIVLVVLSASRQAKAIATPWLDRLAARTR